MLNAIALGLVMAQVPTGPEITVYNQGFGFVKEIRKLNLKQGRQKVEIKDVPSMIESTSVGIRSLTDRNSLRILEQNYQYDLISSQAILNKSVGRHVRFIRTVGNQRDVLEGTLLNAASSIVSNAGGGSSQTYNGMVIKTDDGRIVLDPTGEIEVTTLPSGLISVPTLMWDLTSSAAGPNTVEMSYLTQGMNWNADYVLTIDGSGKGDLEGWVTIDNQSGASWENARLKLLAGTVNRVPEVQTMMKAAGGYGGLMRGAPAPAFKEESLFEYHLYTLQRPATVRNRETKQISLLEGHDISVQKKLIVDSMGGYSNYYPSEGEVGNGPIHTQVRLELINSEANHLGMPFPKGNVKVYQRDSQGSVQMLGEDGIDHTPRDEKISLVVGTSFDIVGNRKRTSYTRVSNTEAVESFEIEIRNHKKTPETVHVYERRWGDWTITKKSDEFVKLDENTADFVINLKPDEVRTVSYTVDTKW